MQIKFETIANEDGSRTILLYCYMTKKCIAIKIAKNEITTLEAKKLLIEKLEEINKVAKICQ